MRSPTTSLPIPTLLSVLLSLTTFTTLPSRTHSKAILGVDLGSLYMKVALVQRNSPLEIVTNMHSKRKTEQMVLFDAGSRFYGADASSLMARKPHLTPSAMSVMLGRDEGHPVVQVLAERHYHFTPSYNSTRSGICLTIDNAQFTPEELVAMVLTHAKDITAAYGVTTPVKDCVLTVPSFYTQHERRALLDAAELAELNVLALINENTAAALHYGIDRVDESPQHYLFYNMGAGAVQVSVVRYSSYMRKESKYSKEKRVGSFEVLGVGWDATLGGSSFDARLVDYMADEFNELWNKKRNDGESKDVRSSPRAMAKLLIQANKIKHVLSANSDIPVFIDALQDDVNYQTHVSRAKFEEICHDLLIRAANPIWDALKMANMTYAELDAVEMIGGAMRVPKVQEAVSAALGGKVELGMHLNSDESMALGAAFHGANVSTSFKVRHVGMVDINPFPVAVDLMDLEVQKEEEKKESQGGSDSESESESGEEKKEKKGLFGIGKKKDKNKKDDTEGEKKEGDDEAWSKHATIFKLGSRVGIKKTIAFSYDKDVHVSVNYEEGSETLPAGTGLSIEQYDVVGVAEFAKEMGEKGLGIPKVSLQFELTASGLTQLIKAEAVVEEVVIVEEEVEVEEDDEAENATDAAVSTESTDKDGSDAEEKAGEEKKETEEHAPAEEDAPAKDEKTDGSEETKEEPKTEKKKDETKVKKTKIVQKEKKKKHTRPLSISSYHTGRIRPYTPQIMAESKAKLLLLAQKDKERMMLEEAKNKFESYIYHIRNKLLDDEDAITKVTTDEQRELLRKSAEEAEEWMFDEGYDADLETYQNKYDELSAPAEKVFFRLSELEARPRAIETLNTKLGKVEELMKKWETTMIHITEEERKEVLERVEEVRKWITDKVEEQEKADVTGEPVFTSEEVPGQMKKIESVVSRLMKKPKPKPEVKKNDSDKNETGTTNNETATTGEEGTAAGSDDASGAESTGAEGETKESETKESATTTGDAGEGSEEREPASEGEGEAEKKEQEMVGEEL